MLSSTAKTRRSPLVSYAGLNGKLRRPHSHTHMQIHTPTIMPTSWSSCLLGPELQGILVKFYHLANNLSVLNKLKLH